MRLTKLDQLWVVFVFGLSDLFDELLDRLQLVRGEQF